MAGENHLENTRSRRPRDGGRNTKFSQMPEDESESILMTSAEKVDGKMGRWAATLWGGREWLHW